MKAKIIDNNPPRHHFKKGKIVEVVYVDDKYAECKDSNGLYQSLSKKDLEFIGGEV